MTTTLALADSLLNDPFYVAITIDFPEQRRERLAQYFHHSLEEARVSGMVIEESPHGAALWLGPRPDATAKARKLKALARVLGPQGMSNFHAMVAAMDEQLEQKIPAHAWYLSILGVDPQLQRTGLGSRLLRRWQPDCPAYLETFGPQTLSFYQKLGFETIHDYLEPTTQERCWVMLRQT